MSADALFGATVRHAQAGQYEAQGLKLVLHCYSIDAIDGDGVNNLEGVRSAVAQNVIDKVVKYAGRHDLAVSRL